MSDEKSKEQKEVNWVAQREYARSRNLHLKSVQDAIKHGRLSKCLVKVKGVNKIIPEIADNEWATNTNHDRRPKTHEGNINANDYTSIEDTKRKLEGLPSSLEAFAKALAFEGFAPDIAESRAFHEAYKAKLLELEFKEKSRELIPSEEIKTVWTDLLKNFQAKIRSIPAKLTPVLANTHEEDEIEEILASALDQALNELSEVEFE